MQDTNCELEQADVWDNPERARKLGQLRAQLQEVVEGIDTISASLEDAALLLDLAIAENDSDTLEALLEDVNASEQKIAKLEFKRMFTNQLDANNCFLEIQAGSGGTEAQDWADMLLRMYLRFVDAQGFKAEVLEISQAEVAGIKSASIKVNGEYAYGWLRSETGVHRLVRKSPFDSGNRRHTSFAAVFVAAEIDDNIEVDINPADLRIDVYRASGAGGQHVNRTESAVRITHLPTNTVVQCQNDRSQHRNKDTAMKQLRSKLYELAMQQEREKSQSLEDNKADIGWGSQIRSYVLDASRIKDLRTNLETGNTQAVLDGDLEPFISASLKAGF